MSSFCFKFPMCLEYNPNLLMAHTALWDCPLNLTLCPSPSAYCSLGLVSLLQKSVLCIYVPGTVRGAGNITMDNEETDPLLRELLSLWEEQIINKEINNLRQL